MLNKRTHNIDRVVCGQQQINLNHVRPLSLHDTMWCDVMNVLCVEPTSDCNKSAFVFVEYRHIRAHLHESDTRHTYRDISNIVINNSFCKALLYFATCLRVPYGNKVFSFLGECAHHFIFSQSQSTQSSVLMFSNNIMYVEVFWKSFRLVKNEKKISMKNDEERNSKPRVIFFLEGGTKILITYIITIVMNLT